jgi:hypothetical protein
MARRSSGRGGGAGPGGRVPVGVAVAFSFVVFTVEAETDADDFVGEFRAVGFDAELFAEGEEDVGEGLGLVGVGGEDFVAAGGAGAAEGGTLAIVRGDQEECFAELGLARVGARGGRGQEAGSGGAGGEAGFEGDEFADRLGEADEGCDRVGFAGAAGDFGPGAARGGGLGRLRRGRRGLGPGLGGLGLVFRWVRFGQLGEGLGGGGAGQLHAELFQLRQHAQVARGAGGRVFRLGWSDCGRDGEVRGGHGGADISPSLGFRSRSFFLWRMGEKPRAALLAWRFKCVRVLDFLGWSAV